MLAGKAAIANSQGPAINKVGGGIIRTGYGSKRSVNKKF